MAGFREKWRNFKFPFKPKALPYTVSIAGAGLSFIFAPYIGIPAEIVGGVSLIAGYMFYDMAAKYEKNNQIERQKERNNLFMGELTSNEIGREIKAQAGNHGIMIDPLGEHRIPQTASRSNSYYFILNAAGNVAGTALLGAGVGLQASTEENSDAKKIVGTVIGAVGLATALTVHHITASKLDDQLTSLQSAERNLQTLVRKQDNNVRIEGIDLAIKEGLNQELEAVEAITTNFRIR